jgi:hypothetical protein
MALQLRRGTNAQRLGLTPVEGEMIYVTDNVLVSISVTSIDIGTDVLTTSVEHGLILNQQIKYIGATLNGLTKDQVYYVKTTPLTTTFTLSASLGGGTLNITGTYTVPLVFAKTPCLASGAPVGTDVSPLWAGDGTTVGGNPSGAILLDELRDVVITQPAVEGEFLWYNGTSWVNENETTVDTREKTLSLTRRSTSLGENYENEVTLRLQDRLTDSRSYANDEGGPAIQYERSSGVQYTKTYVSGGAIGAYTVTLNNVTNLVVGDRITGTGLTNSNAGVLITVIAGNQLTLDTAFTVQAEGSYTVGAPIAFGHVAMEWVGSTNLHRYKVTTSTDNYREFPANEYPGTNTLIESTKNGTKFNDSSVYIDAVNDRIGINDLNPDYDLAINKSPTASIGLKNTDITFSIINDADLNKASIKWGTSNRLEFDGSNQWFNSGNTGINNSSPTVALEINGGLLQYTGTSVDRPTFRYDATNTGSNNAIRLRKNYTNIGNTGAYTTGDGVGIGLQLDSDTQDLRQPGIVDMIWDATAPTIRLRTNTTTSFDTGYVNVGTFTSEVATLPAGLNVKSGALFVKDSNGYVGINTVTPAYTLDVNGTANVETSLTVPSISTLTGDDLSIAAFAGENINITGTGDGSPVVGGEITLTGNLSANPVTLVRNTALTNSATRVATLRANSTGTPASGLGGQLVWEVETAASVFPQGGYIETVSTDVASNNEKFTMRFGLMNRTGVIPAEAAAPKMSLSGTGDLQIDGTLRLDSSEDVANGAAVSLETAASYFTTGASNETATLAAGTAGQFKSLMMRGDGGGDMVITVTNPGWGGAGTITFNGIGDSCLLQYVNSKWFAVGANSVVFA